MSRLVIRHRGEDQMVGHDVNSEFPSFVYAVEQGTWVRDKLFRVYVNDQMICGACVAGQVRDAQSFQLDVGGHWAINWLLVPMLRRQLARRYAREQFYDQVDPFAQDIRAFDRRNFRIAAGDIVRIRFQYTRIAEVPHSVGVIEVATFSGPVRRLTVLGDGLPHHVVQDLRGLSQNVEVEGAQDFSTLAERDAFHQRNDLAQSGYGALYLAVGLVFVWATGLLTDIRLPLLAIFCAGWGIWTLWQTQQAEKPAT